MTAKCRGGRGARCVLWLMCTRLYVSWFSYWFFSLSFSYQKSKGKENKVLFFMVMVSSSYLVCAIFWFSVFFFSSRLCMYMYVNYVSVNYVSVKKFVACTAGLHPMMSQIACGCVRGGGVRDVGMFHECLMTSLPGCATLGNATLWLPLSRVVHPSRYYTLGQHIRP